MHNLRSLLVFDIETIPDTNACALLLKDDSIEHESEAKKRELLVNYHLDITDGKNDFLRQPFHKIVEISILKAKIEQDKYSQEETFSLEKIVSLRSSSPTEKEMISKFFTGMELNKARLVSFNGKMFDIPVLKYRAMLHGVQAGYFYNSGDKWNSYSQKYSLDWHCDLIDLFSDFGTSAKIKMSEVCSAFRIPGKMGIDGSNVSSLYDNGNFAELREYCELDTVNTYLLYLRAMHHRGKLNTQSYNKCIDDLISYFDKQEQSHFLQFKEEWIKIANGDLHL